MLEFYEPRFLCEEEFIYKLRTNLINNFHLDNFSASDLALEIMELLTMADTNLDDLNNYIMAG